MFKNLGLHVIQFPSKRWGFVGSIPAALGYEIPASTAAVMGCRSYYNEKKELVEMKFPTFETEDDALTFKALKGF